MEKNKKNIAYLKENLMKTEMEEWKVRVEEMGYWRGKTGLKQFIWGS